MKRLSIVVPMYNVEPFVEKCLRYLVEQDIPQEEYEIICVNDGSPDNSRDIVLKFKEKYSNVVLLDQENQGVSMARNNGIDIATGKYLLFIDPDDYTDSNCFKNILQKADDNDAEVVHLGFTVLDEFDKEKAAVHHEGISTTVVEGIKAYSLCHVEGRPDPDRIYGILIKRDLLNTYKLRFLEGVPYLEDGELMTRISCIASRCLFIKGTFYWRTTRPGSATNSDLFYSKRAIDGFIKSASNLRVFRETLSLSVEQRQYLNQPIVKYVILSLSASSKFTDYKTYRYVRASLLKNNFNKLELEGIDKTYKKLGGFFNISISLLHCYLLFRPIGLSVKNILNKLKFK
ncbi:glycosyltransferase [Carboxylicivirga sp. N1Y90]|uniref:glycosyltransferase family 2 protein n=1 Tax=Carboxylicivirga fragile TaxID=3417571 RepID=UPI003D346C81|nr:glycosyltransferase [Marinilabiliaceae bacterium N1Y90]